jgi:two-component system response regulator AtoC
MEDKKQNILIIDDERSSADSLAIGLERNGFLPQVAVSGEEGLKKLQYENFDFILCDINMPEMNGWEFASKLPVLKSSTNLIFITAETAMENRKEHKDIPVLTKPIELEMLVSYLKHWDDKNLSESRVLEE